MTSAPAERLPAVDPSSYLGLARELARRSEPVARRSAVDRAYYAAFLAMREAFRVKHYPLEKGRNEHSAVVNTVSALRQDIGDQQKRLYDLRNLVTYNVGEVVFPEGTSVEWALATARIVIRMARGLPARPSRQSKLNLPAKRRS